MVETRKLFDYTHYATELIQPKSGSLIDLLASVRHDINDYHYKWYKEVLELPKKFNIVEEDSSRQMLRENYSSDSSSGYYKLSLAVPLLDSF